MAFRNVLHRQALSDEWDISNSKHIRMMPTTLNHNHVYMSHWFHLLISRVTHTHYSNHWRLWPFFFGLCLAWKAVSAGSAEKAIDCTISQSLNVMTIRTDWSYLSLYFFVSGGIFLLFFCGEWSANIKESAIVHRWSVVKHESNWFFLLLSYNQYVQIGKSSVYIFNKLSFSDQTIVYLLFKVKVWIISIGKVV